MPSAKPKGDPFDALGDPNRRAIVEILRGGDQPVGVIADQLPISRPAVSRHLALLKKAGLVIEETKGVQNLYRLHDEGVDAVRAYLQKVWGEASVRFRLRAENTKPRRKHS
jgi:DNA-binding transcriptional ArsR family regulator